jgi:hypothetical protein
MKKLVLGALAFLLLSAPARAQPTGLVLSGDGPCKLYPDSNWFYSLKSYAWTGSCKDGVADGVGQIQATSNNGDQLVWRHARQGGRYVASQPEDQTVYRQGDLLTLRIGAGVKTKDRAIAVDELPAWARKFLLSRPYPYSVVSAGKCKVEFPTDEHALVERLRWNGPCENGRAHGIGVLQMTFKDGARTAARQYRESAAMRGHRDVEYIQIFEQGGVYTRMASGSGEDKDTTIDRKDVPAWARSFLFATPVANAKAQPTRKASAVADATSSKSVADARLRREVESGRITTPSGQAPDWVSISPVFKIDIASVAVTNESGVYQVYEQGVGIPAGRVYVSCEGLKFGASPQRLQELDHSSDYQVGLVREVCRRTTIAAASSSLPSYARPAIPQGWQTVDGGNCKVIIWPDNSRQSVTWQGRCVDGFAEGEGFVGVLYGDNRHIAKVFATMGLVRSRTETYSRNSGGSTSVWSHDKWVDFPPQQLPNWAQSFLDTQPLVVAAALSSQQAEAEREEEEWRRQMEERRRRYREEQEGDAQRERESNARMQAWGSMLAESRRQQQDAEARRRAQQADTARQNELYRQQRAAQEQRQLEAQRRQQAQLDQQRREQIAQSSSSNAEGDKVGVGCVAPWRDGQRLSYGTRQFPSSGCVRCGAYGKWESAPGECKHLGEDRPPPDGNTDRPGLR